MGQETISSRQVIALDGEGITTPDGRHLYTFFNCYLTHVRDHVYVENWREGLPTEYIFYLLTHHVRLPANDRRTITCGYFLDYDITIWLRDLSQEQKGVLWRDGKVVWQSPIRGTLYYLRYIPHKLFFVGQWAPDMGMACNIFNWRTGYRGRLIYDVAGFQQQSFIKTIKDWSLTDPDTLALVKAKKEERSTFTPDKAPEIGRYCQLECELLAKYVQTLDITLQAENIKLRSWHGAGALAQQVLRQHHIADQIADPSPTHMLQPGLGQAIMHAYYGGRVELLQQGHFNHLHDYDLHSAYPAASLRVPDLTHGQWFYVEDIHHETMIDHYPYALWFCRWDVQRFTQPGVPYLAPFPFRYKYGVYYPVRGEGWVHGPEVIEALKRYGTNSLQILRGYVFLPDTPTFPMEFLRDMAARRVALDVAGETSRARVLKFALNSMYGKFVQRDTEIDHKATFQSYYAGGFITSLTRARLVRMTLSRTGDARDVVMLATDGLFTLEGRYEHLGDGLGQWGYAGRIPECYVIQPGVWFTRDRSASKTRGFSPRSLTYEQVAEEWQRNGPQGELYYEETRFVGLGSSVARGNFSQYGTWPDVIRKALFYPARKYAPAIDFALYKEVRESVALICPDMYGMVSEPYVPAPPCDFSESNEYIARRIAEIEHYDQPDWED